MKRHGGGASFRMASRFLIASIWLQSVSRWALHLLTNSWSVGLPRLFLAATSACHCSLCLAITSGSPGVLYPLSPVGWLFLSSGVRITVESGVAAGFGGALGTLTVAEVSVWAVGG